MTILRTGHLNQTGPRNLHAFAALLPSFANTVAGPTEDADMLSRRIMTYLGRRPFRSGDDGAVTVDWVVLTAALVFMGIAATFYVTSSVPEVANQISTYMDGMTVVPD